MRDTITIGVIAGVLATVVMTLFNSALRLFGLDFVSTWETAAHTILNPKLIHTPIGYFIGYICQFILGSIFGVVVAYTLRLTGKDYYLLKGIGVGAVIWLASIGLFMRLLHLQIQGRSEPITNIMAVIQFNIMGVTSSMIIAKYAKFKLK